jgi:hypothetical protein
MRRFRAATVLLIPAATLVVLAQDVVWPLARSAGGRFAAWRVLAPLRRRVAALPAAAALPLFLVPELCSRCGTLVSAWLLLQGDGWRALAIYAGSKLFAGATALWIYTACEPALLRVRAFAMIHGAVGELRRAALARARRRAPRAGQFAALLRRTRARNLARRAPTP